MIKQQYCGSLSETYLFVYLKFLLDSVSYWYYIKQYIVLCQANIFEV